MEFKNPLVKEYYKTKKIILIFDCRVLKRDVVEFRKNFNNLIIKISLSLSYNSFSKLAVKYRIYYL